ncbi:MAG TPA: DUF4328 domain-containing protein [Acidimicrobiales bacterium]|nr:DUF4328 domain-containing protein [Acidimicrobiales bacterium]
MTTPPPGPPAGWYPDPAGGGGSRWWDGSRWTEHLAGPPSPSVPAAPQQPVPTYPTAPRQPIPTYPAAPQQPIPAYPATAGWASGPGWATAEARRLVADEGGVAAWARWSVAVYAVVAVAQMAVLVTRYGGSFDRWDRFFHQVSTAAQDGRPTPTLPSDLAFPGYLWPFSVAAIASGVLFLVWQYRAANAARSLRLPATHRPGWGVAFWFIPVANLFCPYQALRDCLPPGDAGRSRQLRLWWTYLATVVASIGCEVSAVFSRPAGFALLAVMAVLWVAVVVGSVKAIDHIGASHRAITDISPGR